MKYLKTNYKLFESEINAIIEKCKIYKIEKYEIDDDGLLTVHGDVDLRGLKLNEIPFSFKEVYGYFDAAVSNIKSLKGSPEIIYGDFYFYDTLIKDLKYCPKEIHGGVYGHFNKKLNTFIEFPKHVGLEIDFSYCNLKNLYGCIEKYNGIFIIDNNTSLKSLRYGPKHVNMSYICSNCGLITLYGAPNYVGGDFNCKNNKLTSLKYSPQYIGCDFNFEYNNIKSLYYFPDHVDDEIYCKNNPIYEIWKLFKDKNHIDYFNQMKIITDENKINIKKLNLFLKSIDKEPVKIVKGYVNI